jgi:hypothetical protein
VVLGDNSPGGVEIGSIEDARRVVQREKDYGADMLKEYLQTRRDARQWLSQAAREIGLEITADNSTDFVMDMTLVLDGYTAFEHMIPRSPLYNDVVQFLAKSGVHNTPTLIVGIIGTGDNYYYLNTDFHSDAKLRRFTPEWSLDRHRRVLHLPDDEWQWMRWAEDAAKITKAGGNISLGAHGNRQGLGAQWELWMLHKGGLTNMEALRAATIIPAIKIGRDGDIGSLEAGKLADFVVLNANPVTDIRNSAAIQYTVRDGIVYDAASMTEVWPAYKPLARFYWQTDADLKQFGVPAPKPLTGK